MHRYFALSLLAEFSFPVTLAPFSMMLDHWRHRPSGGLSYRIVHELYHPSRAGRLLLQASPCLRVDHHQNGTR